MRLNKYIAACGVASRRGADQLIADGKITVNGNTILSMGQDVDTEKDVVCLDGTPLCISEQLMYIMLNKPAGVLSSCTDNRGRTTVIDLLTGVKERVFPVGRLDYDTEGLLLLTNDGDFAYQCTHPKYEVTKKYYAIVKGKLNDNVIATLEGNVKIDGGATSGAKIDILKKSSKRTELYITIHEGKNRHIKKLFQLVGCRVSYLKRVAIGDLQLNNLESGKWRKLTKNDIKLLKSDK